jgi:two-component system, chemotaxis family, response regulator Rcp1
MKHRSDQSVDILVAEDNIADVRLLEEVLKEQGLAHRLNVVSDGEEALRVAEGIGKTGETPCPDLFVLDLHLPKIDGPEILRRFRENENCADTPVIVLTTSVSPYDRAAVEGFKGVSYLLKPSTLDEFTTIGKFIYKVLNLGTPQ